MDTRDLSLSSWGPYAKHYAGYSHILENGNLSMVDFIPLLGHERGRVVVPDINFESDHHVMAANADLSFIRYRFDLQWKDTEYCDVTFVRSDDGVLARFHFVNQSPRAKSYMTSLMAVNRPFQLERVSLPEGAVWRGAEDYLALEVAQEAIEWKVGEHYEGNNTNRQIHHGKDGFRRGVATGGFLVDGLGLGNCDVAQRGSMGDDNRSFVFPVGTKITLAGAEGAGCCPAAMRFWPGNITRMTMAVRVGETVQWVTLVGPSRPDDLNLVMVPLAESIPAGHAIELEVIALETASADAPQFVLDGLLLGASGSAEATASFRPSVEQAPCWEFTREEGESGLHAVSNADPDYGFFLLSADERPRPPFPYSDATVTHVRHHELSGSRILRKIANDSLFNWYHVNCDIKGDNQNHFLGYNLGPVVVEAGASRTLDVAIVGGMVSPAELRERATRVLAKVDAIVAQVGPERTVGGPEQWAFGMGLLASYTFANVTFPVRIGKEVVRTYTPGKRWGGLFTWDSGMHGIGLNELDPARAAEILEQYLPLTADDEVAAVLHGTPLPLHVYLLSEVYRTSGDLEWLRKFFGRAQHYWSYFAGRHPASPYDAGEVGMLSSYADGYNSQGIDDYPPQHYEGLAGLYGRVKTNSITSHVIRTAKLLRDFAVMLGEPTAPFDETIAYLADGLQRLAWNEVSTWFEHVDAETQAPILHPDGVSFNMGLDGVAPLIAGVCRPEQEVCLIDHIMSPAELWTPSGITAVSQSAPYFRTDGYWNGKVWMPHQWFLWKTMLTLGRFVEAKQIADTALGVFCAAADETYNSYELFDLRHGMGQGCHQFAGLSSPLLAFHAAYFRPGNVAVGFDTLMVPVARETPRWRLLSPTAGKLRALICPLAGREVRVDGVVQPRTEGVVCLDLEGSEGDLQL